MSTKPSQASLNWSELQSDMLSQCMRSELWSVEAETPVSSLQITTHVMNCILKDSKPVKDCISEPCRVLLLQKQLFWLNLPRISQDWLKRTALSQLAQGKSWRRGWWRTRLLNVTSNLRQVWCTCCELSVATISWGGCDIFGMTATGYHSCTW